MEEYTDPDQPGAPQEGDVSSGPAVSETHVYTDPRDPGAPQEGDIVVVVEDFGPRSYVGKVCRVVAVQGTWVTNADAGHHAGRVGRWWVNAVRWPTPAELLQYQLGAQTT